MTKLLFGTDPEYAPWYLKDGMAYVLPAAYFRMFLGVKTQPNGRHPIFVSNDVSYCHEDGVAVEIAVKPEHNWETLFDNVASARTLFENNVLKLFPNECEPTLAALPTINYEVERWLKYQDNPEFKHSMEFGCDPDEDAFHMEKKCKILDVSKHPERYMGGHIHISGSPTIAEEPILAVKSLAFTLGLAAIAYSDVPESEKARTFLYGLPGKHRVQKYGADNPYGKEYAVGIEYRTCSTRWTASREHAKQVFTWATIGIKNLLEGGLVKSLEKEISQDAVDSILNADQTKAQQILDYVSGLV